MDRRTRNSNGRLYDHRKRNWKGKPFTIFKFRTMIADTDPYTFLPKTSNDQRLTKVGKIIRRLCLDELPQLFNVIAGDMSLVGPRPELPNIVEHYSCQDRLRLKVRPGITGIWQLKAPRNQMIHKNIQYDLEYLAKRNFLFDIKIIIRTVPFILGLNNA